MIPTTEVAGLPDPLPAGLLVLDVREQDEWDAGHVAGSVHVPLMTLADSLATLPASEQTLVVCRSGNRSAHATAFLVQQGLDAVNLAGGLLAWQWARRPLVTDGGDPGQVF